MKIDDKIKIVMNKPFTACVFLYDPNFYDEYVTPERISKIGENCFKTDNMDDFYHEYIEEFDWLFIREISELNEIDFEVEIDFDRILNLRFKFNALIYLRSSNNRIYSLKKKVEIN